MNLIIRPFLVLLGVVFCSQVTLAVPVSCPTPEEIHWTKGKPFKNGFKWEGKTEAGWSGTVMTSRPTATGNPMLSPANKVTVFKSKGIIEEWKLNCFYHNDETVTLGVGSLHYSSSQDCTPKEDNKSFNCSVDKKLSPKGV